MVLRAYAKINLGLKVLDKRRDGYHNIETVFHRIDLFDELTLEPSAESVELTGEGFEVPLDEENLCWKAIDILRARSGTAHGAGIRIMKRIPVGAGLGGGSSDAAAVLSALPSLWKISVDPSTLADIALELGSDVPFFLHNRSAFASGRGEVLNFVKVSVPYWILLVTPNIQISTAWAYSQIPAFNGAQRKRTKLYDESTCTIAPLPALMENDFESVVFAAYPAIGDLKRDLRKWGAEHALLSGSGSSVFGLFATEAAASAAADLLRKKYFVSLTPPNFFPSL